MWQVQLIKGKDWPRNPDGTFVFQLNWEMKGFANTMELVLDMTELIHHMGNVVTGNSSFCVALGVTALHQQGVHGQFLIKKRRYWPKHVPRDYIDQYMMANLLGTTETFVQELGGLCLFVYCTHDAD